MSAPFRFPKFFVTNPSPCPYLPGKVERKVFTELTGRHASELNEALGRIGSKVGQRAQTALGDESNGKLIRKLPLLQPLQADEAPAEPAPKGGSRLAVPPAG